MNVKIEDIFGVESDPTLDLTSQLDNLTLENIPDDIFEFSDEIPTFNIVHSDIEKVTPPLEANNARSACADFSQGYEKFIKASLPDGKLYVTKHDNEANLDKPEGQKDVNGNEESAAVENLNNGIDKLNLSDSENEEETENSELRERGPIRNRRRNREQNNSGNNCYDTSEIDIDRRRFHSGGSHVQVNDTRPTPNLLFNFATNLSSTSVNSNDSLFYEYSEANSTHSSTIIPNETVILAPSDLFDEGLTSCTQNSNITQFRNVNDTPNVSFYGDFATSSVNTSISQNENSDPICNYSDSFLVNSNTNSVSNLQSGYDFEALFADSSATIQNETVVSAPSTIFSEGLAIRSTQNESVTQVVPRNLYFKDFAPSSARADISQTESINLMQNYSDSFHDDSCVNCVSSPESGYDTASPLSVSTSPPHISLASSHFILDSIAERVDEQDVFDFVIEYQSHTSAPPTSLDDEEYSKKKILYYLKGQAEQSEISDVNRELGLTEPSERFNGNIESVLRELNELTYVESNADGGLKQEELNELSQLTSNVNGEYIPEELSKLSHVASDENAENVYSELNRSLVSVMNGEHLPAEVSVPDARSEGVPLMNSLDLNSISCVRTPPAVSPSSQNNTKTPIACMPLGEKARKALRSSLPDKEIRATEQKIFKRINKDMQNKKEVKVIYIEDEGDKTSENQTNLHRAVLNSNIEEIYCLCFIHKRYGMPFSDLNLRDKHGKTALDYAIQNNLTLVIDYLKENNACCSVNI